MVSGRKAHARYCGDADHPFLALHITSRLIWWPLFQCLLTSIQHYLTCRAAAPKTTSVCIAVPQLQASPSLHLLGGMQLFTVSLWDAFA